MRGMTMRNLMNYYGLRGAQLEFKLDALCAKNHMIGDRQFLDPLHFAQIYDKLEAELDICETLNDLFADLIRMRGYAQDK